MQMRLSKEDMLFKYLAVAPLLLLLIAFAAYPIISLLNMSFSDVTIVEGRQTTTWTGFKNYIQTIG